MAKSIEGDVTKRVIRVVAENLYISEDEVRLDSDFKKDLDVDSLDAVVISAAIEKEFRLRIPDVDMDKIHDVSDLVYYVIDWLIYEPNQ